MSGGWISEEGGGRAEGGAGGQAATAEGSRIVAASPEGMMARAVQWLEGLPRGLSREGVVLCGSALLRHRLRLHVASTLERPELLLGVRMVSPATWARQVLANAGEPATGGASAARRLRLRDELRRASGLGLLYFDPVQVAREQGYIEAFARTVATLEQAGLRPRDLVEYAEDFGDVDGRRVRDVAMVWYAVQGDQGHTDASAYRRAAALLGPGDRAAPTLALVTEAPGPALAEFFEALGPDRLVYLEARPESAGSERRRASLGLSVAGEPGERPPAAGSELERLKAMLFLPGGEPGPGYDGTVEIEAYASVEEELEAAVGWIIEEVQRGTRLSRIALVVPRVELLGGLLLDRLSRADPPIPAYLAGGQPRAETPGGVRVLAVLEALGSGLEAASTLRCLPWLVAISEGPVEELSPSRAAEVVYGAGIMGGTSRDLRGGLEWTARLRHRHEELRQRILGGAEPEGSTARARSERWIAEVAPRLPAVAALEEILRQVAEDEVTLEVLAPDVLAFMERWLSLPDGQGAEGEEAEGGAELLARLGLEFEALTRDRAARRLRGVAALTALRSAVARARSPRGRLSEGVFVGSARQCAGVSFDAVRMIGLAEGVFPRLPHDDPVLPSDLREKIEAAAAARGQRRLLRRIEDDLDDDLHAFFRVVRGARERLALSAPYQWIDRTEHAISGVILEVVNALGVDVRRASGLSSLGHLHAERLRPGVERLRRAMLARPSTPRAAFLARRARYEQDGHVPTSWLLDRELSMFAAAAPPAPRARLVPGLCPERPLSPSWLKMLLGCPFHFLQEKLLDRAPTEGRPPTDRLEARIFGTLVHDASERVFVERGALLCGHEGSLPDHLEFGRDALEGAFEELLGTYPLRGGETARRELERAWEIFEEVLRQEWARPARSFDAVELGFGFDAPAALQVGEHKLYLRGRIDRLDRLQGGGYSVRDLKTGQGRSLAEEALNVGRDVQIGVYARIIEEVLRPGGQVVEAAYDYPKRGGAPSRVFVGEALEALKASTGRWLEAAVGLLAAFAFPRATSRTECRYCPFLALCGPGAAEQSAKALESAVDPALVAFRALKEAQNG